MAAPHHLNIEDIEGSRIKSFRKLMRFKVRDILLVASLYDQYLFEEDGRLYELIRQEFQGLNLSHPPELTHVTTSAEAMEVLDQEGPFDLIITTLHIEDMNAVRFAQRVRESGLDTPIVLLAYDNRERKEIVTHYDTSVFDQIFIWQGDYRLIIAIIKSIEDRLNVDNDTKAVGVQSIILLEDNVKFYSSYLPIIYTEILNQSQRLISEGVNLSHRFLRMRARPKILLCNDVRRGVDLLRAVPGDAPRHHLRHQLHAQRRRRTRRAGSGSRRWSNGSTPTSPSSCSPAAARWNRAHASSACRFS